MQIIHNTSITCLNFLYEINVNIIFLCFCIIVNQDSHVYAILQYDKVNKYNVFF